jgi:hypothetical protein
MSYRDDVAALSARHDALAAEVAEKTRQLEESRTLLEQARARVRLPVLDQIRVASPCTADWERMTGDHQIRHCDDCRKDVYNLSGMTRDEAEALIRKHHGELCVRYYQRPDGTILLADCTVGVDRLRRRTRTVARAAALVAGGLVVADAAVMSQATMGKLAPHDEAPCQLPDPGALVMMEKVERVAPPAPDVPPAPDAPPAADVKSREQAEIEALFPPESLATATQRAQRELERLRKRLQLAPDPGQFLMGATRSLTWDAPSPAQPSHAAPASRPPPPRPPPLGPSPVAPPPVIVTFVAGRERSTSVTVDGRPQSAAAAAELVALLAGPHYIDSEIGCVTEPSAVRLERDGRVLDLEIDGCGHVRLAGGALIGLASQRATVRLRELLSPP